MFDYSIHAAAVILMETMWDPAVISLMEMWIFFRNFTYSELVVHDQHDARLSSSDITTSDFPAVTWPDHVKPIKTRNQNWCKCTLKAVEFLYILRPTFSKYILNDFSTDGQSK